jgi:uncharacterized protein YecE (DUF72 family)
MSLYVGTSGWSYREWKPSFYPADVPQRRWLEFYSSVLGACEINATYYRLQAPTTFARWTAQTRSEFKFTAKAHRRITHSRGLAPDDARLTFMDRYFKSIAGLGPRLGAILLQFPPHKRRDDGALDALLAALPVDLPFAVEFRHDSWSDAAVAARVACAGGTVCLSETTGSVPASLPPGPLAYVRLRADRYRRKTRAQWLELVGGAAEARDVFVFVKHEGGPADDPLSGLGLARWLATHAPERRTLTR